MKDIDIIAELLRRKWFFARRMWDNGPEWFVEAWNKEKDEWYESSNKRLSVAFKEVRELYEEMENWIPG